MGAVLTRAAAKTAVAARGVCEYTGGKGSFYLLDGAY